ncbi:hypothetical protein [Actinomadura algeriensis]|uniref:Uncharacterized protein n=1 Tax=Actinomadura algeriensis TaxID=1679523 RepID=A0ABR9JL19_9ACTN|nr:hypothetical protein [Actinomadura algeriensis]MBE1531149.1 hypothetical protein [Actinomadura algeriensis]
MALPPTTRSLINSANALNRWAMEPDRTAATAPGRAAFEARFEKQVDPDGVLSPDERARRAAAARKAHFKRMAANSAKSRAKAAALRAETSGDAA